VLGRAFPARPCTHVSQGPAPLVFNLKGAGRESNLLNHVLHTGSRVCIGDRRSCCVRDVSALYPLSYGAILRVAPVGLEPTTSGLVGMYSNSAVGRFLRVRKMPNEVVPRRRALRHTLTRC